MAKVEMAKYIGSLLKHCDVRRFTSQREHSAEVLGWYVLDEKMVDWVPVADRGAWVNWANEFCGIDKEGRAVLRLGKIGCWRLKIFCLGDQSIHLSVGCIDTYAHKIFFGGDAVEEYSSEFRTYRGAQRYFTIVSNLLKKNLESIVSPRLPGFYQCVASSCDGLVGIHIDADNHGDWYASRGGIESRTGVAVVNQDYLSERKLEFRRCFIFGSGFGGTKFCRIAGDFLGDGVVSNEVGVFTKTDRTVDDYIQIAADKCKYFRAALDRHMEKVAASEQVSEKVGGSNEVG